VEREKLLIDILKIKLLFFSAIVGGSFGYLLKVNNFFYLIILYFLIFSGVVGVINSLYHRKTI